MYFGKNSTLFLPFSYDFYFCFIFLQGHFYSRYSNPTRDSLESCLAALDNGKHALAYPAGVAAVTALLYLLKHGDHIVSCAEQYGGTRSLLLEYVEIQGIEIDFVDATVLKNIENAIKPNTKVFFYIFYFDLTFLSLNAFSSWCGLKLHPIHF